MFSKNLKYYRLKKGLTKKLLLTKRMSPQWRLRTMRAARENRIWIP